MNLNKKAYVNDVLTGSAMLLGFFLILGFSIFLLIEWNDTVQSSSAFTDGAKSGQQEFTDTYPSMMGWLFPAVFIGLLLYTLITAYLVEVISKVWFIIGFIVTVIQAVIGYVLQQAYDRLSEISVFGTAGTYIPGATLYFENLILINALWAFMILLALYFKREG